MAPRFVPMTAEELALTFPTEIEHVSPSSLGMFARCPLSEQYRRRYLLGQKQPPALALAWGDADHQAIEAHLLAKQENGTGLGLGEVKDRFVAALEERVESDGGLGEMEDVDAEKVFEKARRLGPELVACYHQGQAQFLMPSQVEQEFVIDAPSLPVVVKGRIDLVARDWHPLTQELGAVETERILDRKTAARSKRGPEQDWKMKARVYQLEVPLPFEWQISIKALEPKVQTGPEFRMPLMPRATTLKWIEGQVAQIGHFYMVYGPDQEWPTSALVHPWACGYCGYRPDCAWQAGS